MGQLAVVSPDLGATEKRQPRQLQALHTGGDRFDTHELTFDMASGQPARTMLALRFILSRKATAANKPAGRAPSSEEPDGAPCTTPLSGNALYDPPLVHQRIRF